MTPSNNANRILIVGGGIAGLTFGAALRKEGLDPHIVERADEWSPVGAGIVLGVNATSLYRDLDLLDPLEARGRVIERGHITDASGRTLATMDLASIAPPGEKTISIHRAALHEVLAAENLNVTFGATVDAVEPSEDEVRVTLSNGDRSSYDLVVGADGIGSRVRDLVFGEVERRYSGYTCWRFIVHGDFGLTETVEMWGRGKRFGIVPIGGDAIYCYATLNAPRASQEMAAVDVGRFQELFAEFRGDAPMILEALTDRTSLIHNDLEEVHMDRWVRGRIALMGDAAHGMTPNMGQGAAMAIEDAVVLCQSLEESPALSYGLRQYESRRHGRVDLIQRRSWNFGKIGQIESGAVCAVRNAMLKVVPDAFAQNSVKQLLLAEI